MYRKQNTVIVPVMIGLALCVTSSAALGADIFLDADTPATGSLLDSQPLVTAFGTITFDGEISLVGDPDLVAVGGSGDALDINGSQTAQLSFDFEIVSARFVYGGNLGSILVEARNAGGGVVDSFFQANTDDGFPAGPVTLSGSGIRSLYWEDPGWNYAVLDNMEIMVPEPATLSLLLLGGLTLRRGRQ